MTPGPLARFERVHTEHRRLCDALEALADALPGPRRADCLGAALAVRGLRLHRAEEEGALFPLLRRRCTADRFVLSSLRQLEVEHAQDRAAEVELVETLQDLAAHAPSPIGAEGAGYALRSFFEAKRRHMAWEEIHVLPLARDVLGRTDLARLEGAVLRLGGGHVPRCAALVEGL